MSDYLPGPIQIYALQRGREWHLARVGRIGASTGGVPLGISAYNSPQDLWQVLFDAGIDPRYWDFPSTPETWHGTRYEPLACMLYERLTGNTVKQTGLWMNPGRWPLWVHATPDGLVREAVETGARRHCLDGEGRPWPCNGLLEIKCPVYKMYASVPAGYLAQTQQQMWTLDFEWVDFFVYFREEATASLWRVHRSRGWEAWARTKIELFRSCASKQEARTRLPWLAKEMQALIDSDWNWATVARQQRKSETYLREHLPTERVHIEHRWRVQLARASATTA